MICTAKKSFTLSQGIGKDLINVDQGTQLNFIKQTHHFYHAYYESHSYTALFHLNEQPIEIKFHRVHNTKPFQVMSCDWSYDNRRKIFWDDVFNESCPLNEEKAGD